MHRGAMLAAVLIGSAISAVVGSQDAVACANCDGGASFVITGPNAVADPQGHWNCVSGNGFRVIVTVKRAGGATATNYTGTVLISANSSSGGKIPLTSTTFTPADAGVKTVSGLILTIIYGTNPLRTLYFDDNTCNIHGSINVAVWFNVFATREGLVCGTVACGAHVDERDHFVALPAEPSCLHGVYVRNGPYLETTGWEDRGPRLNDPYWNTSGIPSDTVGIDLADGTFWDSLHMTDNGYVVWRFFG